MTFLKKLLHEVNNPILKYLCKFQNDILIKARGLQIQKISTDLYRGNLVGMQKLNSWLTMMSAKILVNDLSEKTFTGGE